MRLINTDKLKFPNIMVFEMKLHGVMVPMVRVLDLKELMPAVDAAPVVHGHWEDVGSLSCRCSDCGCKNDRETRFCPNCGAKMDLEDKEYATNDIL